MAFWGIEVKPGKPITHSCEKALRRLRISQATLGIGGATKRTIVQCNVGNRSPVLLCVLLPNKTESCHLDLEFEEADDVVFSVIGPRSVYLTGYYVRQIHHSNPHSDTESYGVDIENSPTEGSSYGIDEDKYDDSFINDDEELKVSAQSPILSSQGLDEVALENEKPKERRGRGKKLKKKCRVIESDSDAKAHESEDEDDDDHSLSEFRIKRAANTTISDAGEKIAPVTVETGFDTKDDGVCGNESKEKFDDLDIDGKLERAFDEEGAEVMNEKNELPKEMETLEETTVSNEKVLTGDTIHQNNETDTIANQNLPMRNVREQVQSLDLSKPKKKRKRTMKEKTCEVPLDSKDDGVLREDKENEVKASANMENGQKSKKRRNELELEGTITDGVDGKGNNIPKDDKFEEGLQHSENLTAVNEESEERQSLEKICIEALGALSQNNMANEDKMAEILPNADSTMKDLAAENGDSEEQHVDKNVSTKIEVLTNDSKPEKKTKKKKKGKMKKTQGEINLNMDATKTTDNQETMPMKHEDQNTNAEPIQKTLSNGLIIEELASGHSDGKVATPGKKVKIFYTGMLKESGLVFDSNVDKTAFKFQLGDEKLIDGWNVGIEGMHVGDKRRLIVPPSMGFGDHAIGENIPPNSWLVYDVELVSIRR